MPMMEDYHRTLSRHLCDVLDRIGLSTDERETIMNTSLTFSILFTLTLQLADTEHVRYMFGSRCEATTTESMQSDMDIVTCDERYPVVDDLNDAPRSGYCFLIERDSSPAAGYVNLQFVKFVTSLSVNRPHNLKSQSFGFGNKGRLARSRYSQLESKVFFEERTSPVITLLHVPYLVSSVDMVWAYRCSKWPEFAMEWLTRERQFKWPSPERIDKLSTMGCLFVAVGHPHSRHLQEWRTSFSLQERDLMFSLNSVQHKCYTLMKVTKLDVMQPAVGDVITSYQCKTVLFYAIETTPAEFWVSENLVKCFLHCLRALYLCVEQGVCPNYFIPEANLFDRSDLYGDLRLRKQVANMLHALLQENGQFLFRITCDDIGRQMSAASNPQKYASTIENMSTKYGQITNDVKYRRYLSVSNLIVSTVNNMSSHAALVNDTSATIDTIENQLYQLAITTTVTEHTVGQTKEAIDLILPLLHTSVACHMASRLLSMPHGSNEVENIRAAVGEHAYQATISEIISCRLKVATIHYMLSKYEESECVLSVVVCAFLPFVTNVCACCRSEPHINGLLLNKIASGELSHSDVLKSCVSSCVSFLPTEMEATPIAMRYEMFKAVGTPEETRNSEMYKWGIVDGRVLLHYLQYLVFNEKGDGQRKRLAVEQLEDAVTDATLYHRETAYNLLGWIYTREGDINKAARCLFISIRIQPVHNAAKWHIGELYLRTSLSAR